MRFVYCACNAVYILYTAEIEVLIEAVAHLQHSSNK